MAASAGGSCSVYYRCCLIATLLLLLLVVVPAVRAAAAAATDVPREKEVVDPSLIAAAHTCRDVFMECQAGVANKACCTAISKKIRDHRRWGHPCVCRQLRGKYCRLAGRCSTAFCPNCAPCVRCSLEDDEGVPIAQP